MRIFVLPFYLQRFFETKNRYLRNVSIKQTRYQNKPNIEFNTDGTLKFVELDIVNLNNMGNWEKVITLHSLSIDANNN